MRRTYFKGQNEANLKGNTNIWFDIVDLTHFKPDTRYDLITAFDAIHDQARPDKVLTTVYQALKPDGLFLMQDIDASSHLHKNKEYPLGAMLYAVSTMHCMTVSLAQGGMGLGTVWGVETVEKMLREAGFTKVEIKRLKHDVQNCYYLVKK